MLNKVLAAIDSLSTHCLMQNEGCPAETSQAMILVDKFDINAVLSSHHANHHWQQEPNPQLNLAFFSPGCQIEPSSLLPRMSPLEKGNFWNKYCC